jgi:hypothetical protein
MTYRHCVDADEADYYATCCCDPSRRKITGCDGWTLQCGKCDVCGRQGHTRPFPGPVAYTGAWCNYHYNMLCEVPLKQIVSAYRRTHRNPGSVSLLLCGGDLCSDDYLKLERDLFIHADWRSWGFEREFIEYLEARRPRGDVGPMTEDQEFDLETKLHWTKIALLRELPWTFSADQKRLVIDELMSMSTET